MSNLPRTLILQGGKEVKVSQVFYPLGRAFYRVGWTTPDGERGCIAENEGTRFVEFSREEFLAEVRGVKKNDS